MYSYLYVGLLLFFVFIYIRDNFGTNQSYSTVDGSSGDGDLSSKVISEIGLEEVSSEYSNEKGLVTVPY